MSAFQESVAVMGRYLVLVAAGVIVLWLAVSIQTLWRRSRQSRVYTPAELKERLDLDI